MYIYIYIHNIYIYIYIYIHIHLYILKRFEARVLNPRAAARLSLEMLWKGAKAQDLGLFPRFIFRKLT